MKKQLMDMVVEMMNEVFGETEVVRNLLFDRGMIEFMNCIIYIDFNDDNDNDIRFGLRHDSISTENLSFKGLTKQLKVIYGE